MQNTGNNCFCGENPLHSCSFLSNENLPLVVPERSALHEDVVPACRAAWALGWVFNSGLAGNAVLIHFLA